MKGFIGFISLIALVVMAQAALAADPIFTRRLLTNQSDSTTVVFNTGYLTKKTIVFQGYTTGGATKLLSGTAALNCGPTSTGPFVPCKDKSGTVVTTTANGMFNLDDLSPYVQLVWTKTSKLISVWLFYQ